MQILKKILKWVFGIALGLILLFVLVAALTGYKEFQYRETAVPYIKKAIPLISEWNPAEAKTLFVPETLEGVSDDDYTKLFRWFSKLGSLESMEEPQFNQVQSGVTVREGASTIVTYSVLAHYEHGDAQITIRLLDLESTFEIYQFSINSTALIE